MSYRCSKIGVSVTNRPKGFPGGGAGPVGPLKGVVGVKREGMRVGGVSGASGAPAVGQEDGLRGELESLLARAGLDGDAVTVFADAVLLAGAVGQGRAVEEVPVGFSPASRVQDPGWGISGEAADPTSVDAHCEVAERAQVGVEAVNQVISRLERVRLVAVGEEVVAMGRAELARAGVDEAGDLSTAGRQRWRWRSKSRVRQDLAPATGWSKNETATMVAVATAPGPFRAPVGSALSRGTATWALVRHLWRSCERARLSATDAAHVAHVLLADDPASCVPERLASDGAATTDPWGQGAFWAAADREIMKLAACPDPEDEDSVKAAEEAKAAREAAYAGRAMQVRVNEDGTAQVFFTGTVLKVLALGDRLEKAARAARGAGDARTVVQLANDIGVALLGHAVIGAHELPDLDIFQGATPTAEDLATAGWTPQVIAAISALPAAVLQVVVPLLALHDPAQAHTLPGVARQVGTKDLDGQTLDGPCQDRQAHEESIADDVTAGDDGADAGAAAGHTGAPGCPGCLPSARAALHHAMDEESRQRRQDSSALDQDGCPGEDYGPDQYRHVDDRDLGQDSAHDQQDGREDAAVDAGRRPRAVWVGRVLGKHPGFLTPDLVRRLALSPGSTLVRLLVDPADGRCLERSTTAYRFDAAMRAQLAAADVTCRAPGCEHHAAGCQVDHVVEHATGGATKETNAQLLDVWHHDPKTAKVWDAVLHANRDVTWTTTLSRVYRTRVHDYRELVTVITDALERVAAVPEDDVADQINQEVYQALCYRGSDERLAEGDDDPDDDARLARFGGRITIGLSHRDPRTGRRTPVPSLAAQTRADTTAALARTTPPRSGAGGTGQTRQGWTAAEGHGADNERTTSQGHRPDSDRPRAADHPGQPGTRQTPWTRRDYGPPPF